MCDKVKPTTNLQHLFSVRLGVKRCLSTQYWVLFWRDTQLIVEGVMPDLLHIVPVGDDTVLERVAKTQHAATTLRLVTNITVLRTHANHYILKVNNDA